jgi:hypothetical protein
MCALRQRQRVTGREYQLEIGSCVKTATASLQAGDLEISLGILRHGILLSEQYTPYAFESAAQLVRLVALLQAFDERRLARSFSHACA